MTDIHTSTASQVFQVGYNDVTTEQRKFAKKLHFGICYGMSHERLNNFMNESKEYQKKMHVVLSCTKEFYDADIVGKAPYFQNVSENFQGQDEISFEYPVCKQDHTSLIYG